MWVFSGTFVNVMFSQSPFLYFIMKGQLFNITPNTGFPSEEIQQWAISKKIASYVVKQGVRLVDLTNLREFISHIERMGIQKLYLQLIIQDKEEEINEIISQFDDYLFCLRSLKNISPLLKLIIAELSTFIHDKKDRLIFTEITSGAKIEDVAKRCGISYDGSACKKTWAS